MGKANPESDKGAGVKTFVSAKPERILYLSKLWQCQQGHSAWEHELLVSHGIKPTGATSWFCPTAKADGMKCGMALRQVPGAEREARFHAYCYSTRDPFEISVLEKKFPLLNQRLRMLIAAKLWGHLRLNLAPILGELRAVYAKDPKAYAKARFDLLAKLEKASGMKLETLEAWVHSANWSDFLDDDLADMLRREHERPTHTAGDATTSAFLDAEVSQ